MANNFGTDILIQAEDPESAASFYVDHLGFEVTGKTPQMFSLHGENINFFIERGPAWDQCWKSPWRMYFDCGQTTFNPGPIATCLKSHLIGKFDS